MAETGDLAKGAAAGAAAGSLTGPIGIIVGAGLGLTASAIAARRTAKLNKKRQALVDQRRQDLQRWFDKEYNKNIMDTDYGRAVQTSIEQNTNKANQQVANTAAITGATDESQIAAKANINENTTGALANVAAQGYGRKEGVRQEYVGRQTGLDRGQSDIWDMTAQNWANVAKNANNFLSDTQTMAGLGEAGGALMNYYKNKNAQNNSVLANPISSNPVTTTD